jgi:pyruvate formate lyase activating enzyme
MEEAEESSQQWKPDRRTFLAEMSRLGTAASFGPLVWRLLEGEAQAAADPGPVAAKYWHKEDGGVQCDLCPRRETLADGMAGFCRVRYSRGGKLVTHGYDRPCVLNIDPIEKNPLAHVHPGSEMLAVAHAGCNLRCLYCQNFQYSQSSPLETRNIRDFSRSDAVGKANERKLKGLTFTYTEPATCPEFVAEMADLARSKGLVPTLCTCGFVLPGPFRELLKPFAAVTITYKGATEDFYQKVCSASLKPVMDAMLLAKAEKKWLEVATLVVPTLNDDAESLKTMAEWIARNLGTDTPWHIERFMPMYKLTKLPPTPRATLEQARQTGLDAGLKFVYISNYAPHEGNHTYCPQCKHSVILRLGFKILKNELRDGQCPKCACSLPGLWK